MSGMPAQGWRSGTAWPEIAGPPGQQGPALSRRRSKAGLTGGGVQKHGSHGLVTGIEPARSDGDGCGTTAVQGLAVERRLAARTTSAATHEGTPVMAWENSVS